MKCDQHLTETTSSKLNYQLRSTFIMIRDPEKEPERWKEPIVANTPNEAQRECQKRADEYELDLESVTKPNKIEDRPQRYECNYKEKD